MITDLEFLHSNQVLKMQFGTAVEDLHLLQLEELLLTALAIFSDLFCIAES